VIVWLAGADSFNDQTVAVTTLRCFGNCCAIANYQLIGDQAAAGQQRVVV
jgi:hypothetical protein